MGRAVYVKKKVDGDDQRRALAIPDLPDLKEKKTIELVVAALKNSSQKQLASSDPESIWRDLGLDSSPLPDWPDDFLPAPVERYMNAAPNNKKVFIEKAFAVVATSASAAELKKNLMRLLPQRDWAEMVLRSAKAGNLSAQLFVRSPDFVTTCLLHGTARDLDDWLSFTPERARIDELAGGAANGLNGELFFALAGKKLIDLGRNGTRSMELLHQAIKQRNRERVNSLKTLPGFAALLAPHPVSGDSALELAVASGDLPIIETINGLMTRWPVCKGKKHPHQVAMAAGFTDIASYLMERVSRQFLARYKDEQGNTALHDAARAGLVELVPELVQIGLDIHAKNHDFDCPLSVLLRSLAQIDPDDPDTLGRRTAILNGMDPLVAPALLNTRNHSLLTWLRHEPKGWNRDRPWDLLIDVRDMRFLEKWLKPEHVNIRDKHFRTPLARAMTREGERNPLMKLLLERGADFSTETFLGTNAGLLGDPRFHAAKLPDKKPLRMLGLMGAFHGDKKVPAEALDFNDIFRKQRARAEIAVLRPEQASQVLAHLGETFDRKGWTRDQAKIEGKLRKKLAASNGAGFRGVDLLSFMKSNTAVPEYVVVNALFPIEFMQGDIRVALDKAGATPDAAVEEEAHQAPHAPTQSRVETFMADLPDFRRDLPYTLDFWPQ